MAPASSAASVSRAGTPERNDGIRTSGKCQFTNSRAQADGPLSGSSPPKAAFYLWGLVSLPSARMGKEQVCYHTERSQNSSCKTKFKAG